MIVPRPRHAPAGESGSKSGVAGVSMPAWWWWPGGILLGLCTWQVTSLLPTETPGFFVVGLHLAAHDGLRFGHDIVFTYGPLAFLTFPVLVTSWTGAAAFAFVAFLHLTLATVALRLALDSIPWPLAIVTAAVAAALPVPPADQVVLLVFAACVWALGRDRPAHGVLLMAAGGAVAAFELLVKFNDGLLVLILLLLAAWNVRPGALRGEATLLGSFAVSGLVLWLISGNRLGDLPEWLRLSVHLVAGYGQGMQRPAVPGELVLALLTLACFLLLAYRQALGFTDRRRRAALVLVVAAFSFAYFKEGFVRYDSAHTSVFFATVGAALLLVSWRSPLLVIGALTLAAATIDSLGDANGSLAVLLLLALVAFATWMLGRERWPHRRRLATTLVAVGLGVGLAAADGRWLDRGSLQPALGDFTAQAHTLIDPARRDAALAAYRASWRTRYGLPPRLVASLRDHSVDVEPWGATLAWAYGFDWTPEPLLESYAAYDAVLDRFVADALGHHGPERILQQHPATAIDTQNPYWQAPGLVLSQMCSYRQTALASGFAVFERTPGRCGRPRSLVNVTIRPNEWLRVPRAGSRDIVFARMQLPHAFSATLRSLLYKPSSVTVELSSGASFGLVPGVAGEPLVLRAPSVDLPAAARLRVNGVAAPVRVAFYALPLSEILPARRAGRHGAGPS